MLFLLLSTFVFPTPLPKKNFQTVPSLLLSIFLRVGMSTPSYRPLLEAASKILGQPIVPVNKPGASGTLGPASLKTVKPDGYTLSVGIINLLIVPHMEDVAFDPLKDFTYIIRIYCGQFGIVVRSDSPWKTLKDLVEYARQHPNEIKYSTSLREGFTISPWKRLPERGDQVENSPLSWWG